MPDRVYIGRGIRIRNHCGAEPPSDPQPAGLLAAVGGSDRAQAPNAAAGGVKAPESASRRRLRGVDDRRAAPTVPAEARTIASVGRVARAVPPVLVRSRRCARTPSRPRGYVFTGKGKRDSEATQPTPQAS